MKKFVLFLVLIAMTMLFDAYQAWASRIDEDVCQSMYFRRSAYTERNPGLAQFKEESRQREKDFIRAERQRKLSNKWKLAVNREDENFVEAKEQIKTIKPGLTTKRDILSIPGMPAYVVDPSRPWRTISWRMREYMKYDGYPAPRDAQKIVSGRYYFAETNLPRMGIRLELLATLNKYTKVVDDSRCYLEPGYILDYMKVQ